MSDINNTIAVTIHKNFPLFLIEKNIIDKSTPVADNATPELLKNKRVITSALPYYLAQHASELIIVPLNMKPEQRGRELSIEELRDQCGELAIYTVTQTTNVKIELVVTRHKALVEYLREIHVADNDTDILEHVSVSDIRNKHVAGILPIEIASHARSFTELPMQLPRELFQKDLSIEDMRKYIKSAPVTYFVKKVI